MIELVALSMVLLGSALFFSALRLRVVNSPAINLPVAAAARRHELQQTPAKALAEKWITVVTPRIANRNWATTVAGLLEPSVVRLSYPLGLVPIEWVAGSLISAVLGGFVLGALLLTTSGVMCGAVAGGMLPAVWLRSQATAQTDQILKQFPDFLDTTTLLLEAGTDLAGAMDRYARNSGESVLGRHLAISLNELKTGRRLADVARDLNQRLDIAELQAFFAGLEESTKSGASLAPVFRIQAETLRDRRFERAEKRAAESVIKMTLPLMLIFAAVLTIVLGPLLAQFIGGI